MARSITGVAQHRLKKPTIGLSKIGCEVQAVASPHGESGRNLAVRMSHQRRIWTVSATAVAWIHGGTGRHFANRTSHQPRTWTVPATAVLGFKGWGRPILHRPDVAPAPHREPPANAASLQSPARDSWYGKLGKATPDNRGRCSLLHSPGRGDERPSSRPFGHSIHSDGRPGRTPGG